MMALSAADSTAQQRPSRPKRETIYYEVEGSTPTSTSLGEGMSNTSEDITEKFEQSSIAIEKMATVTDSVDENLGKREIVANGCNLVKPNDESIPAPLCREELPGVDAIEDLPTVEVLHTIPLPEMKPKSESRSEEEVKLWCGKGSDSVYSNSCHDLGQRIYIKDSASSSIIPCKSEYVRSESEGRPESTTLPEDSQTMATTDDPFESLEGQKSSRITWAYFSTLTKGRSFLTKDPEVPRLTTARKSLDTAFILRSEKESPTPVSNSKGMEFPTFPNFTSGRTEDDKPTSPHQIEPQGQDKREGFGFLKKKGSSLRLRERFNSVLSKAKKSFSKTTSCGPNDQEGSLSGPHAMSPPIRSPPPPRIPSIFVDSDFNSSELNDTLCKIATQERAAKVQEEEVALMMPSSPTEIPEGALSDPAFSDKKEMVTPPQKPSDMNFEALDWNLDIIFEQLPESKLDVPEFVNVRYSKVMAENEANELQQQIAMGTVEVIEPSIVAPAAVEATLSNSSSAVSEIKDFIEVQETPASCELLQWDAPVPESKASAPSIFKEPEGQHQLLDPVVPSMETCPLPPSPPTQAVACDDSC
jgi:hypothetical protein